MTTLEYIKNLVFKKRFWIHEKKKQIWQNGGPAKNKKFVDGEEFLYLEKSYAEKRWGSCGPKGSSILIGS